MSRRHRERPAQAAPIRPRTSRYDVEAHVAATAPLVTTGSDVVGHSDGAILAAAFSAAYPERVRALVLVGLPSYTDRTTAGREFGRLGLLPRWRVEGRTLGGLVCEAMCWVRPLVVAAAPMLIRDLPCAIAEDGACHTRRSFEGTLRVVVADAPVELHVVKGDHHVAVHEPERVASGIAGLVSLPDEGATGRG